MPSQPNTRGALLQLPLIRQINVFDPCYVAFPDVRARRWSMTDRQGRGRRARSTSPRTGNPIASMLE
jgi:hypothetical protein